MHPTVQAVTVVLGFLIVIGVVSWVLSYLRPYINSTSEGFIGGGAAKLTFQCNGAWAIYRNDQLIKEGDNTGGDVTIHEVDNLQTGDRIIVKINANGEKGGFIGQVETINESWDTDRNSFVCLGQAVSSELVSSGFQPYAGGRYMGCYGLLEEEGKPVSETTEAEEMANQGVLNKQACQARAIEKKVGYYAMTGGDTCLVGERYNQGKIGNKFFCGMPCKSSTGANHGYCGGAGYYQAFSSLDPPSILERTDDEVKPRSSSISKTAKWLFPRQSELSTDWPQGTWAYEWTYNSSVKIPFCGNRLYAEFNPSGCTNMDTPDLCRASVRSNYVYDDGQCRSAYLAPTPTDGDVFRSMIDRAYMKSIGDSRNPWDAHAEDFLLTMQNTYKAACQYLEEVGEKTDYKAWCGNNTSKRERMTEMACHIIPEEQRKPAKDMGDYLGCDAGSLECELLKTDCVKAGHCFDANSKPKCYEFPESDAVEDLFINSPGFYEAVAKAYSLANERDRRDGGSETLLRDQVKRLVEAARVSEVNPGDSMGCPCRSEMDESSLMCNPC